MSSNTASDNNSTIVATKLAVTLCNDNYFKLMDPRVVVVNSQVQQCCCFYSVSSLVGTLCYVYLTYVYTTEYIY